MEVEQHSIKITIGERSHRRNERFLNTMRMKEVTRTMRHSKSCTKWEAHSTIEGHKKIRTGIEKQYKLYLKKLEKKRTRGTSSK